MADRIYGEFEVPEIATDPGPPDTPGFVRIYGRNGRLFVRGFATAEIDLAESGTGGDKNVDGGAPDSLYLPEQNIDGGGP